MAKAGNNTSIMGWLLHPTTQYTPLADVAFGANNIVMPQALPPTSMRFPTPEANKMLNLPGVQTIYDAKPSGRVL